MILHHSIQTLILKRTFQGKRCTVLNTNGYSQSISLNKSQDYYQLYINSDHVTIFHSSIVITKLEHHDYIFNIFLFQQLAYHAFSYLDYIHLYMLVSQVYSACNKCQFSCGMVCIIFFSLLQGFVLFIKNTLNQTFFLLSYYTFVSILS